ncbi:hypothetical protein KO02_09095 [Sphingobacterium sp. ML3W]|uniref:SusD/RagB family nutrient-binding outer membrane lipoprotein n=1 Tax=Sphingobacterium sp. ML3W TaxID=1538644 RepID=UPI0004F72B8D|nr:SusD/RagB family nutrient-binding outer membrane lipoprotein [Sphingobacterium sp. ML3W]AIM36838.1 hypothetical protein KO02_09095 [Sphingobacterium sp. ML3W]
MNNNIKSSICIGLSLMTLWSCSNFDDINTNPNASTQVTSGMLATGLLIGMTKQDQEYGSFIDHNFLSKHALTAELIRDYQYNKFATGSFGAYGNLRNVNKMIENAAESVRPSYEGLGAFIRAYQLFYLSLDLGDIPYSEASLGESEGIVKPKYDTQKEVMQHVLRDLDLANERFALNIPFDGDPLLNGNPINWMKVVNAFKIKVLINLHVHEADVELKVKEQFAELLNQRILLEKNEENLQLVYSNKGSQIYPFNDLNARSNGYVMLSSNLVDSLKIYRDNRLFYFAEPAVYMTSQGKTKDDFNAYVSIDPSSPFNEITKLYDEKKYTGLNNRYMALNNPAGEPIVRIGYAEQCFNIAEGIERGWAQGDAKAYYEKGVRAAMSFVKANTPAEFVKERPAISDDFIDSYLKSPKASYIGDRATKLNKIFQQKYFIYFLQNPWDGYYENRRTDFPRLPINPNTNMNQVVSQLPKRWTYPQNEYNENSANIKEALQRQYSGKDDNNDLMWLLKK